MAMNTDAREMRVPDSGADYTPDEDRSKALENLDPITKYAVTMMEEAVEHAKSANQEQHALFEKVRKLYKGDVQRKRNYKGAADLWPNVVFEAIDSQIPILFRNLFPDLDFFDVEAQGEKHLKDDTVLKQLARLHTALAQISLEDMGFMGKAIKVLRYMLKYGTVIMMPYWNYQRAKIRARQEIQEPVLGPDGMPQMQPTAVDPISGMPINFKPMTQPREIPVYTEAVTRDGADFLVIDPRDFYPADPEMGDMQMMDFVCRRFDTTINKLRAQEARDDYGFYRNLDLLDRVASAAKDSEREESVTAVSTRPDKLGKDVSCMEIWISPGLFDPLNVPNTDEADIAEFCEAWGLEPTELDGGWVMTLADKLIPIRIQPNPNKMQDLPFIKHSFYEVDNKFWGMGIPELIESYQYEIADKRNQAMDAVTRAIRPLWLFAADAIEDRKDPLKRFTSGEEDYLAIDPANAPQGLQSVVHEVVTRVNPQYPFMAAQEAKMDMQSMTGTSNNMAGAESFNRATATEVNVREQSGMSRVELRVMESEFGWVAPLLQWIYRLNDQYFDRDKAVKVAGENGVVWERLSDEDFALDLKFTPKGSRLLANKLAAMQQIVQLSQSPLFAQFINAPELLEDLFRLFLRMPNPKKYILDPNEPHVPVPIELQEQLFAAGHSSDVDPMQPLEEGMMELQQHMMIHQQRGMMGGAPLEMAARQRHMQMHQIYLQAQQAMMMQQQQAMAAEQGEKPGQPDKETGQFAPDPGGMGRELSSVVG